MQDIFVGDIGDYGKYGLLRAVCAESLSLSINWYRVFPGKEHQRADGKFTSYLSKPQLYRGYDPALFDSLHKILMVENNRKIERIEQEGILKAAYFSEEIGSQRTAWHEKALEQTKGTEVVFLDPDNGLESDNMYRSDGFTNKHVRWTELKDYYDRGQNVIVYQHRPKMTTKEKCIENMLHIQNSFLHADSIRILEFPKCTNRFYAMYIHRNYEIAFERVCDWMSSKWGKDNFCREVILN